MLIHGDSIHIPLADNSVHMCVTSPPYWGLRSYLDNNDPLKHYELGLEPTPDEFVAKMVAIFREVWRVLRPDGSCWVNLGDTFATSANGRSAADTKAAGNDDRTFRDKPFNTAVGGLKPKDLCMIPARVALALQADGWWLRSEIVWNKSNPMPESVTDRPTKSHEMVYLLAKSERYFYDAEAIKEAADPKYAGRYEYEFNVGKKENDGAGRPDRASNTPGLKEFSGTRNRRSVWTISTQSYSGAHYATFPVKLVEPCILAGTSARGVCPKCGNPWTRVVERGQLLAGNGAGRIDNYTGNLDNATENQYRGANFRKSGFAPGHRYESVTTGWQPTCSCGCADTVPAIVLDPFAGSGTVGEVARQLGRRFVGIDLNPTYLALNALPRAENKTAQKAIDELPLFSFSEAAQ